ncbi:MAG TPA: TfoX/Sxy family protein [Solirubrobacteraceae bacterium]|jgi:TfoX/Sxy family transcriptional regulator of competence genes|nr:TfoX/Sxy family protein [Solirubrobacteraceae bacterium]
MAFDEDLAQRIRELLPDTDERRMFGGIGFLVAGNMCCGVRGAELLARVGPEAAATDEPGTRPFEMAGRTSRGWVMVAAEAVAEDADLERWVRRCEAFAARLPPKRSG